MKFETKSLKRCTISLPIPCRKPYFAPASQPKIHLILKKLVMTSLHLPEPGLMHCMSCEYFFMPYEKETNILRRLRLRRPCRHVKVSRRPCAS